MHSFVHDQVQNAAYSLLRKENSNQVFLQIGTKLWYLSSEALDKDLFTICHLLYKGLTAVDIDDPDECVRMAHLFMKAGEKTFASNAVRRAAKYLDTGIKLLCPNCWRNYELCLQLHNAAVKCALCVSNEEKLNALKNDIFENATSILDKVQSRITQIKYYNENVRRENAIKLMFAC